MEQSLEILHEISTVLLRKKTVVALVDEVLLRLIKKLHAIRGAIALLRGNELIVESTYGISDDEKRLAHYQLGEGITGKVALSGKSAIVEDIAFDQRFLNRTKGGNDVEREHLAFICVPVKNAYEVIGTLSIHHPIIASNELKKIADLLAVVANMVAEAISRLREEVNERAFLQAENSRLRADLALLLGDHVMIGKSAVMQQLYTKIERLASSMATVLIQGEVGVGKIFVGRALHMASKRRQETFEVINCARFTPEALGVELFGTPTRIGRLQLAQKGTLFLNEFHLVNLEMQELLLNLLENQTYECVNDSTVYHNQARLLFSTTQNLYQAVEDGAFNRHLYEKLLLFELSIPPLREHRSDIPLLANYFLEKYNKIYFKNIHRISEATMQKLIAYDYVGNVSELENCIERAVMLSQDQVLSCMDMIDNDMITVDDMPTHGLKRRVEQFERELIEHTLILNRYNVAKSARHLQTTPRVLRYKMETYAIMNPKLKNKYK